MTFAAHGDLAYEVSWRLARALLLSDRADEAAGHAVRSIELAREAFDRRELGHGLATLALIRSHTGQHDEARDLIDQALDEFRRVQTPYELAETHEIAADLLLAASVPDRPAALGHLFEARRLYSTLGAESARDRAAARIGKTEPARDHVSTAAEGPSTELITISDAMNEIVETARGLASDAGTVLIEGETGTGKELIARIIHDSNVRSGRPFVGINCAAFPAHLLESELFGHSKGAFTGADRDHAGILRSARDGTVLLDEIDKASRDFQAKLLRVIESRRIRPVGSPRSVSFDSRILCASNRGLRRLAEEGTFLKDLYFRLAGFRLVLPALRDRPEDIPVLARHFLQPCANRFESAPYRLSIEAEDALIAYQWPGNVRELKNVLEAAAFYARDTAVIRPGHLPDEIRHPRKACDGALSSRIEEVERVEILAALEKAGGVKAEAARVLGVSRKGLRDRMRRLGLE